jgi:hypothetical protein
VQCRWSEPPPGDAFPAHRNVLTTPLVVDFDLDDDRATVRPSIVFVTYDCDDGACGAEPGCSAVIRIVDGQTCEQQFTLVGQGLLVGSATPAVGDLDGDGRAEVVALHQGGGVMGWRYDAAVRQFVEAWGSYASFNGAGCHWDSVALHDLDDDGRPEIVTNGPSPAAFDTSGRLLDGAALDTSTSTLLHPVLADVDGDGAVELVTGRELVRFDPARRRWMVPMVESAGELGQAALADFGRYGDLPPEDRRQERDGVPEIAVVSSGRVRLQTLQGRVIFGPVPLPGGGLGGPPTVADFDGDGRAEVGVAGASRYSVFDPDCVPGADPGLCPSGATNGVLWSMVTQDASSSVTGSSVFDFEGDGRAEVVYADECFARVYDGRSGAVLSSQHHTSCTWMESPIVADTDGDGRSEIVLPSNGSCRVRCPAIDPVDEGLRCDSQGDCPPRTRCLRDRSTDAVGRCRCQQDSDCGSATLTCAAPPSGAASAGRVCRAAHPSGPPERGIAVLRDALERWVGSRPIWSQHAYAVTHIRDDGTVPRTSAWTANWRTPGLNTFRANAQGASGGRRGPDLTAGPLLSALEQASVCDAEGITLSARLCNRGSDATPAGVPVSFYLSDGMGLPSGPPLCSAISTVRLAPGECTELSCSWPTPPVDAVDIVVRANDDGAGRGATWECRRDNNRGLLAKVSCAQLR